MDEFEQCAHTKCVEIGRRLKLIKKACSSFAAGLVNN
jgi:hypothetical protein